MDAPYDLAVDAFGDDVIVTGERPRLSWKMPVGGGLGPYEVVAEVDGTAVGPVVVAEHVLVPWPFEALRSKQRVAWRVRGDGAGHWSAPHAFEVGLLDADWTAEWISPVEVRDLEPGGRPAYRLATTFEVGEISSARLYATALGVYEAFLDGVRIGDVELAPGATSYDLTLYGQAYDVTRLVTPGAHTLELLVSDGWWRGRVGAFRQPAQWGTALGVRAELHTWDGDGARRVAATDAAWSSGVSEIVRADLMGGQTVDLRAAFGDVTSAQVGVVSGPPISWSPAPPVRCVETRTPVSFTRVRPGVWVADFGQNASGWVALSDLGAAGTRTRIDFGEFVGSEGDLDTSHLDSVRSGQETTTFVQADEVVSDGSGATFEPRHTVHGFRYARLSREGGDVRPESVVMHVVHTDLPVTGTFACSDPDLTRLWEVARWSFRGNAVDIPTDCPTRERVGWTGDWQVFVSTATRLYDVLGFSRKWLKSVRDDQLPDGRVANFSPDGRHVKRGGAGVFEMMTGSAGWGDAVVEVPWQLYLAYGDRDVLAETWDAMVGWAEWALEVARTRRHPSRVERSAEPLPHEAYLWDGSFHWGEWCEPVPKGPDGERLNPVQTNPAAWFSADRGEVGTAYLYRTTSTMAAIAEVLGRRDDAEKYGAVAESVLAAWRTEFLDPAGRAQDDTQASYVRALAFGLVPDELRGAAAARLVELVVQAGSHLATGFLSTADLLPVLADTGHAEVAYDLLLQRTSPSWLAMLDRGATTIWEDWDGIDEDGAAHDSLNHYSKGAVVRFLHSHLLGLRQAERSVAWESFVVEPVLHPGITWARGTLETPQGPIRASWSVEGEDLLVCLDVPAGSSAVVVFPCGRREWLGPGSRRTIRRRLPAASRDPATGVEVDTG